MAREGGGDPGDTLFVNLSPKAMRWLLRVAYAVVVFGAIMSVLWYFHG